MNFFNIAMKSVKKKLFSYVTYFLNTTFAVTVFYVFCSIYYNPQFANYRSGCGYLIFGYRFKSCLRIAFCC